LRFYSSAEAEIILNLFLNFEQKLASCSYKNVLAKKCNATESLWCINLNKFF